MQWRHNWSMRMPRPKVCPLTADQQKRLLTAMVGEIARSPVLSGFGVQVRLRRGRFYIEQPTPAGVEVWGRITPVANDLLLETERRSWNEIAKGSAKKLIKVIAADTKGTFHGLGSLDCSLQEAGQGLTRLPMKVDGGRFVYADSGKECSVHEALFHFFGLPIEVIAEPAEWYSYHRTPRIVEFLEERTRVLVRFSAMSMSGSTFGGTCLYAQREGQWGVFPIRPSENENIATAEAWLVRRKWKAWC